MNVISVWFRNSVDESRLQSFAESVLSLTPEVSLVGKEGLVLEITRSLSLFSRTEIIEKIRMLLRSFDLDGTAVLSEAQNAAFAVAFARYEASEFEALPVLALSDLMNPFKDDVERTAEIESEVARLVAVARKLGIDTLGEFMRVSPQEWASRLGYWAEFAAKTTLDLQAGQKRLAWPRLKPVEKIAERAALPAEDRVFDLESVAFVLKTCVDRLHSRLRGRAQALKSLSLEIELEYGKTHERMRRIDFRFSLAQTESRSTLQLVREKLAREFDQVPLSAPVIAIQVFAQETVTSVEGQKNFFHRHEERKEALGSLVNRLSSRLGMPRVFKARVYESHLPEKSFKKTFHCAGADHNHNSSALAQTFAERPMLLVHPPRMLTRCGKSLFSEMKKWTVQNWQGPERIFSDWWDGEDSRDYFKVETQEGETLWVYRAASRREFFLHGVFG